MHFLRKLKLRIRRRLGGARTLCFCTAVILAGCGSGSTARVGSTTSPLGGSTVSQPAGSTVSSAGTTTQSPTGASTPQAAAFRFIVAQNDQDAAAVCSLVSKHYLAYVRTIAVSANLASAGSSEPCQSLVAKVLQFENSIPGGIDPVDIHPHVVATRNSGDVARVRIAYVISNEAATLAPTTVTVTRSQHGWLVDDYSPK